MAAPRVGAKTRRAGHRPGLVSAALIAPTIILLIAVVAIPELWALYVSLTDASLNSSGRYVGVLNYQTILGDPALWNALRNNVIFVLGDVGCEFLVGLSLALLLSRGYALQRLWVSLIVTPYAMSPVVSVVMWKYMLQPNVGVVNYLLRFVHIINPPWTTNPTLAMASVIVVEAWRSSPFMTIVLYAALLNVPLELREAARVDGAGAWQTFSLILLPLIRPAILVAVVFRIIFAFRTFDVIWVFTQGGPIRATEVLAVFLYNQAFRYWEFGTASATATVMLLATVTLVWYYLARISSEMFGQS